MNALDLLGGANDLVVQTIYGYKGGLGSFWAAATRNDHKLMFQEVKSLI